MFKEELNLVPHLPGSYQMYNKDNIIIKTEIMVNEIDHFEYIVTNSELEAFILELNLIKQFGNLKKQAMLV